MNNLTSLEQRLTTLLAAASSRRAQERSQREEEMQTLEPLRAHFEQVVERWMSDLVVPRLHALGRVMPAARIEHLSGGSSARLTVGCSDAYPVDASLTVSILPANRYERGSVHVQPLLIPMLTGHPAASHCDFGVNLGDSNQLVQFLDDQLMAFAQSYLQVREPESPYQRSALVTDPVCGMTFPRAEAAESEEHGGSRFYFCTSSCAERFLQTPESYSRAGMGAKGE